MRTKRLSWFKEISIIVMIFIVSSVSLDWWHFRNMPQGALPEISIKTLSGQEVDLKAMSEDKPIIIYFWATWCSTCKLVTPTINWIDNSYEVASIAINSGSDKRMKAYLTAHDYQLKTVNDNKGHISKLWGISATPTVLIIKGGEIQSATVGFITPLGLLARLWLTK